MPEEKVLEIKDLPAGAKKTVTVAGTEILLIHHDTGLIAVQSKCPHAGAPLEKGAICNGRLICPWHMGTFALPSGTLIEPPPMQPLTTYTVRQDGNDIYVHSDPLTAPLQKTTGDDQRVFLLIGSGAAGSMAASTLRSEGFTGRIVAVDPVAGEPLDRTQLSKQALAGKMPFDQLSLGTTERCHVEQVTASVTKLDSTANTAQLSNGDTLRFDAALVATGGTPKRLDIPGAERAFTLRHASDVRAILAAAEHARNVVIIGTSFIALEAASALTQKGLHVTVAGQESLPFASKFGDEVAHAIMSFHESKGTQFALEVEITGILPQGVQVQRKSTTPNNFGLIPADLVLFGVGVTPALQFEHDLPIDEKKGGIRVSPDLRAAGSIYVAGDIASVNGTRIEHWRIAEQHGQLAARRMLNIDAAYDSTPFFWTFHYGKRFGYLGHANDWDTIHYDGSVEQLTFLAYYIKDNQVAAILSCGRNTDTATLAEVMRSHPTLEQARAAIRT